jgi:rhodanese-related sulfurtransferase
VNAPCDSVSRDALREKIESDDEFVLIDARSPMSYALSHLPGAINLPLTWVNDRVQRRVPDRDTDVVVYCESVDCESSVKVAERLIELGYRNVTHYAEGQRGWTEAGLALEGDRITG